MPSPFYPLVLRAIDIALELLFEPAIGVLRRDKRTRPFARWLAGHRRVLRVGLVLVLAIGEPIIMLLLG